MCPVHAGESGLTSIPIFGATRRVKGGTTKLRVRVRRKRTTKRSPLLRASNDKPRICGVRLRRAGKNTEEDTLNDQNILVTGCSSGIGRIAAITLARNGNRVFGSMRNTGGKNAAAADELRSIVATHPIEVVDIDICNEQSVMAGVDSVIGKVGHIDILINVAGIMPIGPIEAFSHRQMQKVLTTNVVGPFLMFKAVLPHMRREKSGLVICVSSASGRMLAPGMGIYSTSKMGLEALAEVVGYEVSGFGIDSVIVEPGMFYTKLLENSEPPDDKATLREYKQAGDIGEKAFASFWPDIQSASPADTDPQRVADLLQHLIDTPAGKRPIRIGVGMTYFLDSFNRDAERHQKAFMEKMGVAEFRRVK